MTYTVPIQCTGRPQLDSERTDRLGKVRADQGHFQRGQPVLYMWAILSACGVRLPPPSRPKPQLLAPTAAASTSWMAPFGPKVVGATAFAMNEPFREEGGSDVGTDCLNHVAD